MPMSECIDGFLILVQGCLWAFLRCLAEQGEFLETTIFWPLITVFYDCWEWARGSKTVSLFTQFQVFAS